MLVAWLLQPGGWSIGVAIRLRCLWSAVMRVMAQVAGWGLLAVGCLGVLFAVYITGPESVLSGFWKPVLLALAAGGIAATAGGLVVAYAGIAQRAWLLYGLAVFIHVTWYATAMTVAEHA